jgi:uncharacterized cupredoxin-like copper-binding protein
LLVHIGDPSSNQATTLESQMIHMIQELSGQTLIHEMIVVSVSDPNSPLPYDDKANRVIESKIKQLGEASDLKPGTNKTLKLTLKPGSYLLICNQVDLYHRGMSTTFTVTQ